MFIQRIVIQNLRALRPAADWARSRAVATHARIAGAARGLGFGGVAVCAPLPRAVAEAAQATAGPSRPDS